MVDPLAKLFYSWSPYNYAYNNPLRYTDPDGSIPWDEVIKYTANRSNFGIRTHPKTSKLHGHTGIDLSAPIGSDVRSLADGKVAYIGWDEKEKDGITLGYGRYVVIEHEHGYYSLYAHLDKDGVKYKVGDPVDNGDVIATSGNTGGSTGPHLHLELIKAGGLWGVNNIFERKNKLDPKSIKDLQVLLDQLNGKVGVNSNTIYYPSEDLGEVTITAEKPRKPQPRQVQVQPSNNSHTSPFQRGRLHPGDYGYMGSFWDAYDTVKNWGNKK